MKPIPINEIESLKVIPHDLQRDLDRAMADVFSHPNSAFISSLMCGMEIMFSEDVPFACTAGKWMWLNPTFFQGLPRESRKSLIVHELNHPARLHAIRCDTRDHQTWNDAGDYIINANMMKDGFTFVGLEFGLFNMDYVALSEEEVYDLLMKQKQQNPTNGAGGGGSSNPMQDLIIDPKTAKELAVEVMSNVGKAVMAADLAKQAGTVPGAVRDTIKAAYAAEIPWEEHVREFMTELGSRHYSMRRPRRRYISQDLYLPSLVKQRDKLANLVFYFDVSGSVTDNQAARFLSECRYVKERFQPDKLTIVMFDTEICKEIVIEKNQSMEEIEIVGRGGTSLVCVREHMQQNRPTAAIIFSDLECTPMQKPDVTIPTLWIVMSNLHADIPFGKAVHIKE